MTASPRPLQPNEVAAFIRDAHTGQFDPIEKAQEWVERFCWRSDDPLAATYVAGFALTDYCAEYDAELVEDRLEDHVSAARLAELVDGAEPTEEEKTQYAEEAWGHAVDCGMYCRGEVYRLAAPAGHPEQRVVFFVTVMYDRLGPYVNPSGPFLNLQALYDYCETLQTEGWWIEQAFPEQAECEDLNITTTMHEFANYWGSGPHR